MKRVHITTPITPAHLKDTDRYIFSTQRAGLQHCAQGNMQRGFVEARTNLAKQCQSCLKTAVMSQKL